jgi:hypothetical protein
LLPMARPAIIAQPDGRPGDVCYYQNYACISAARDAARGAQNSALPS